MPIGTYGRRRIEGIQAHLNALRVAHKALEDRKLEGIRAVRRISRSLRSSIPLLEHSPILKSLSAIESASDDEVQAHLASLLTLLNRLTAQIPPINRAILVVDDDPVTLSLLKKTLTS